MSHSRIILMSIALLLTPVATQAALPVVTAQPDVYRVFRGEPIRLQVSVNTVLTKIEWKFNGNLISNPFNTTFYSPNSKTTTTLVVPDATPANSGEYVAYLTNKDGTTLSRTIAVTVSDVENPLDSWKPVLPETVAYGISGLTYLDGRFVAGAANCTIHVSSDGEHWTKADVPRDPLGTSVIQPRIQAIVAHKGRYFAFAEPDSNMSNGVGGWTSEDLLHWNFVPSMPRMGDRAVSNGQRILVTHQIPPFNTREIVSSVDGINWESAPVSSPFHGYWPSRIVAFKGSFFALANGGSKPWYRSADGVTWTNITEPVPDAFINFTGFGQFVEFNGELLFFGFKRLWKSPDGITWSEVIPNGSNPLGTVTPSAAFTGLGRVWISDSNGNCRNSSDLLNWQYLPYVNNSARPSSGVAGTDNVIVCSFNPSGVALTKNSGTNFTIFPSDGITATFGLAPTSAGIFAQASPHARISEDGNSWKSTNAFRIQNSSYNKESMAYGNGVYVRVYSTWRYISMNGIEWKLQSSSGFFSDTDLIFANGRFLTLFPNSSSFNISWSENGTTWSENISVPVNARSLQYVNGQFWALAPGYSINSSGNREYRYATSIDGVTWQIHVIPLSSGANVVTVAGLVAFSGRLILASGDPAWWLASDDGGNTWNRLDTGFGFLRNNQFSTRFNDFSKPAIHNGWLVASSDSGDTIGSSDGFIFHRFDGPGGSFTAHSGALFAANSGGVLRNGDISLPALQTFGLAEGAAPIRGETNEIGIVITDYQDGDRIEFRINGELIYGTDDFYAYYAWDLGVFDEQTLVVSVIRADGSRTSRSWTTGPAAAVQTRSLPPSLPTSGRLAFQQESAGVFYHLTPEGLLRHSTDLFNWNSETLPGLVSPSSYDIGTLRVFTRPDGARLLSLSLGLWTSLPGSGTWTAVGNFPRTLNGATYYIQPSGNHFTLLFKTSRLVPLPSGLNAGKYIYVYDHERFTSTDGLAWTSHGLLPTVGNYKGGNSDGTTILWIEDKNFDEQAGILTPVRLRRLTAGGVTETVEPHPGFASQWVAYMGGKWIIQGNVGSVQKLMISDNSAIWAEVATPRSGIALHGMTSFGDGKWIGYDDSGYYATSDFLNWSPLPTPPPSPVWTGDRWVNGSPRGSGPIDHYESDDLIKWRWVSSLWPTTASTILTVTGDRLVTTLGKGIFTMDAHGKWSILSRMSDVAACKFWNGSWILATKYGGVGIAHEGHDEMWQYPLDAPPPSSERVLDFIDAGSELLAFSNRALYATDDGISWNLRYKPEGRTVNGLVRLGDRLVLESTGSNPAKRIDYSSDEGRTWRIAALPPGSVNYSINSSFGLYVENGAVYYISNSVRYRTEDGETWVLLPYNTDAYLPRPILVEQGTVRWAVSGLPGTGYYQWQFEPSSGLKTIPLTPPIPWTSTPQGGYYRGRIVSLPATGPQITPLANLQLNIPSQPGHTAQAGDVIKVTVEVRNTGFDQAWLDTPLMVDISLDSGQIIGSTALTGSIHTGESVIQEISLVLPRPIASGRHHLIARLRQDGGLPVDGVPEDDETVSSEPLLRVPGSSLRVASLSGGRVWLNSPSEGIVALDSGDTIEREALATLQAIPDAGQRFVGWSEEALGLAPEIPVTATASDELVAYFASGAADYSDWAQNSGLPGADTDLDGTPNVIEFLLDSDPRNGGKRGWSQLTTPNEGPCIEFVEQLGITSHSLRVSISDNLVSWKEVGREQWTPVMRTPAAATWRVRLGSGKSSFARLEAVGP